MRIALLVGYFDWFSGYQETVLARALSRLPDTDLYVIASNRVNPIFTDSHLHRLGIPRSYDEGWSTEFGISILRLSSVEVRSMVLPTPSSLTERLPEVDLLVTMMPGQVLPAVMHRRIRTSARCVVIGDNDAMYAALSSRQAKFKRELFNQTKGRLYRRLSADATALHCYTPNTMAIARRLKSRAPVSLLPLAYDEEIWFPDENFRREERSALGVGDDSLVMLLAGKPGEQKKWLEAVDVVERFAEEHRRTHLVLTGLQDDSYSNELRRRIAGSRLRDHVTIKGFLSGQELNKLFNAADLGLWPVAPAISIQQGMGTGLYVVIPANDYVGHLVKKGSGALLEASSDWEDELLRHLHMAAAELDTQDWNSRVERRRTNLWLSGERVARLLLTSHESMGWSSPGTSEDG